MIKSFLKVAVIVLSLTVFFLIAILIWDQMGKRDSAPQISKIQDSFQSGDSKVFTEGVQADLASTPSGNVLTLTGFVAGDVKVSRLEGVHGFRVEAQGMEAQTIHNLKLPQNSALIKDVSVIEYQKQGKPVVRMDVRLMEGATMAHKMQGKTLMVNLMQKGASDATVAGALKADAAKGATRQGTKAAVSVPKRSRQTAPKRASRPKSKRLNTTQVTPEPSMPDVEPLPENLLVDDGSIPELEGSGSMDVDDVLSDLPSGDAGIPEVGADGGIPELSADGSTDLAMIDPPTDSAPMDQLPSGPPAAQNLPGILALDVAPGGGGTSIRISAEQYRKSKVFRMVNPPRVVVDFKDSANALKASYNGFPGTPVTRVETKQFSGPDGTISRVIFFVEQLPKRVERKTEGADLLLLLP